MSQIPEVQIEGQILTYEEADLQINGYNVRNSSFTSVDLRLCESNEEIQTKERTELVCLQPRRSISSQGLTSVSDTLNSDAIDYEKPEAEENDFGRMVYGAYSCCMDEYFQDFNRQELQLFGMPSRRATLWFWFNEIWTIVLNCPCLLADCIYMFICLSLGWASDTVKSKLDLAIQKWKPYMSEEQDLIDDYGSCEIISPFKYTKDVSRSDQKPYLSAIVRKLRDHKTTSVPEEILNECLYVCKRNYVHRLAVLLDVLGAEVISNMSDSSGLGLLQIALWNRSRDVALLLLKTKLPAMILKQVEQEDYKGETCLHMAILQNDLEMAKACLDSLQNSEARKRLIHKEATGKYINTYMTGARSPLSLAVWTGNEDIVRFLVKSGSQLDYVDLDGNTVVHTVVLMSQDRPEKALEMYDVVMDCAEEWWQSRPNFLPGPFPQMEARYYLLQQPTAANLIPLNLAASCGYKQMMEKIINTEYVYKFTLANFGHKDVAYYDISDLDPVLTQYRDSPSAIEILITVEKDSCLECLSIPLISTLLHRKWENYFIYYAGMAAAYFGYLVLLTCNLLTVNDPDLLNETRKVILARKGNVIEAASCLGAVVIALAAISGLGAVGVLMRRRGAKFSTYTLLWRRAALFICMLGYACVIFAWVGLRAYKKPQQTVPLMMSLLLGWCFLLFFMNGFRPTAFFSRMVERLLLRDLLIFSITYVCITFGFACAFMANLELTGAGKGMPDNFRSLKYTLFTLFRLMVGLVEVEDDLFDKEKYENETTYGFNIALFFGYVLMTTILLLNMVIASMTNTFTEIMSRSELLWLKLRTYNIHLVEVTLPSMLQLFSTQKMTKLYKLKRPDGQIFWRKVYLYKH